MDAEQSPDAAPKPHQELLLKRRNKRRVDLRSLPGVLRESARNYKDLIEGVISLEVAEVRSRAIARHHEILNAVRQEAYVANLAAEVKALRGDVAPQIDPDDE
jgi:hypothetical protein